jgi:hypothetical protein
VREIGKHGSSVLPEKFSELSVAELGLLVPLLKQRLNVAQRQKRFSEPTAWTFG